MKGFILIGKYKQILEVLRALAQFEWDMTNLMSQLDGQVIRLEE